MLISLSLGAIGVGIYVANFRSKPENKYKNFSVATVSLIMITSFLTGLLICGIIYAVTLEAPPCPEKECPTCPTCTWGPAQAKQLADAQQAFRQLEQVVETVPRNLRYSTNCDADPTGTACGVSATPTPQQARAMEIARSARMEQNREDAMEMERLRTPSAPRKYDMQQRRPGRPLSRTPSFASPDDTPYPRRIPTVGKGEW